MPAAELEAGMESRAMNGFVDIEPIRYPVNGAASEKKEGGASAPLAPDWSLYTAASAAGRAWEAELVRLYGKQAPDARYDYARNGMRAPASSALRMLHDARQAALNVWQAHMRLVRGARAG